MFWIYNWLLYPDNILDLSILLLTEDYCFRKKALYPRVGTKFHPAMKKQKKSEPSDGRIFHLK